MIEYIGPAIALLTGIIGILYAKSGERQKLGRVAYILLALIVVSGSVSLYGVHLGKVKAADKARQLQREKKTAETLRGISLAQAFADTDAPADPILYFDLTRPSDEAIDEAPDAPPPPGSSFEPLLGPGVKQANLAFAINDIVEFDYRIGLAGGKTVIDAPFYDSGDKPCRLISEDELSFAPAQGSPCARSDGFIYNAFVEPLNATRTMIINLPKNQPFWKMFSRIEQGQRHSDPVGKISILTLDRAAARRVLGEVDTLKASIKFVKPYDKDPDCVTSLLVHFALEPELTKPTEVTITIGEIEDYELNFCEVPPV